MSKLESGAGTDARGWPDAGDTQSLLEQVKDGDEAAVNPLLARHRDILRRVISMRLDPALAARVDASDIVQEVLIEANSRLPDFVRERPMPFHLWLRRIALDRLIDAHRRHRKAKKRSVDREKRAPVLDGRSTLDLLTQISDHRATPAAAAMHEELARRFQLALTKLGDDDREIILMRHYEHLSNAEVADALGLSAAAAGMRLLRALRRLRSALGEEDEPVGS